MKRKVFYMLSFILCFVCNLSAQTTEDWRSDIDLLSSKIEQYHPMPWSKISKQDFLAKADEIKSNLGS